jgi:transposase-like protein
LRHRDCWPAEYAQSMIVGETVRSAARRCGVHKNTSFRWHHRFLTQLSGAQPSHLHGIVEADETYFLESFKGSRAWRANAAARRPSGGCRKNRSRC